MRVRLSIVRRGDDGQKLHRIAALYDPFLDLSLMLVTSESQSIFFCKNICALNMLVEMTGVHNYPIITFFVASRCVVVTVEASVCYIRKERMFHTCL